MNLSSCRAVTGIGSPGFTVLNVQRFAIVATFLLKLRYRSGVLSHSYFIEFLYFMTLLIVFFRSSKLLSTILMSVRY